MDTAAVDREELRAPCKRVAELQPEKHVLRDHVPEVGRFGDCALPAAAEAVFDADSAYVLHKCSAVYGERPSPPAARGTRTFKRTYRFPPAPVRHEA